MNLRTQLLSSEVSSRLAYWQPRVRDLREEAQALSGEFRRAAETLGSHGAPLPVALWDRHQVWCGKVAHTLAQARAEAAFSTLSLPAEDELKKWVEFFTQTESEIHRVRQALDVARVELSAALEKILDLKAKEGAAEELAELQAVARKLLVQMGNRDTMAQAVEQAQKFAALWELLNDIEQGVADSSDSAARANEVATGFSGRLLWHAFKGRLQPSQGWPLRDIAPPAAAIREKVVKRPIPTPLNTTAAPLLRAIPSRAPANRNVDLAPLEAAAERIAASDREPDDVAAQCYKALREAVTYVIVVSKDYMERENVRAEFEESLQFCATAQSALRVRLQELGRRDESQASVYYWLNEVTKSQKVFIRQHMRLEDPGDPRQMDALLAELEQRNYSRQRPKRIKRALDNLGFKLKKLAGDEDKDVAVWADIVRIVTEVMLEEDVPPSSKELRDALLPRLGDLPGDLAYTPQFELVLRALREHRERTSAAGEADTDSGKRYSADVQEVAKILRGRKLLLVGGIPDPLVRERIETALELGELQWEGAKEHSSSAKFQPMVAAPEVMAVCLIIKLIGHGHVDDIKEYCRQADKPLVLLHKGFGVNQIASNILEQVGQRLKDSLLAKA